MRFLHGVCGAAFGLGLVGCALVGGGVRESSTEGALAPHLLQHRYSRPQGEVLLHALAELKDSHEWHVTHDPVWMANAALENFAELRVTGDLCALGAYGRLHLDLTPFPLQMRTFTVEDSACHWTAEILGPRETTLVTADEANPSGAIVRVLNLANRRRLYHRELSVFERVDPRAATALKTRVGREYPDVSLKPKN